MNAPAQHASPSSQARQRGLGAIAAVFVLVMLAALAAAVVRLGWVGQATFAQDLQGARATQAASAGVEWGLYQALTPSGNWSTCGTGSQTLDLRVELGFWVTVTCSYSSYNEGESAPSTSRVIKVFTINAVACNGTSSCPDNTAATGVNYVERKRQAVATDKIAEE